MRRAGPLALAALAPAVVLAVDPSGWYPFGPIKWLAVLVLGFGGAALVLRDATFHVPRRLGLAIGAFLGWLALAAAFGDDRLYAWTGTPERHLGVLTWALCALLLLVGSSLDERGVRGVVGGLLVAGAGLGAVATAEALGWEPQVLDVASRLSGTLGSPAYLGAATALLLPIAVGAAAPTPAFLGRRASENDGWRHKNAGLWVVVAGLGVACLGVACLGSGARAAWVGLAAAALVTAAAAGGPVWAWALGHRGRALAIGGGAVVVAALVIALSPVGARLGDATDPDSAGGRGRFDEWRVAANVIVDHPLVGVGPEGYRTAFHDGVDERYEREHGRRQQPDRAHSTPLDLALAGGVPLVAAWLAIVAIVGRSAWRILRRGTVGERGLAAALVAHVVGQLLLFPIVELEPIAWLLAGIVVARSTALRSRDAGVTETSPPRRRFAGGGVRWATATAMAMAMATGVLALVGVVAGVTDVVADHRAERAVDALARGDGRAALSAADAAADLRPDVVRLHLLAARAALADQRGTLAALERVDDALAVSPHDPIARLERLSLLVQRAESTQTTAHVSIARRELDARLQVDPFAAALWRLDARLAVVEGRPGAAQRAEARAEALTPPEQRP